MEIKITGMENEVVDFNNLTTNSCTIQVLSRGFNLIRNFYFSQNSVAECLKNLKNTRLPIKGLNVLLGMTMTPVNGYDFPKPTKEAIFVLKGILKNILLYRKA